MGIEINIYRSRIGTFQFNIEQQVKSKYKLSKYYNSKTSSYLNLVILFLITSPLSPYNAAPDLHSPNLTYSVNKTMIPASSINTKTTFNRYSILLPHSCLEPQQTCNHWNSGLKFCGGSEINKVMHMQNGNRRNLGYKIASWNCNRGLLQAGEGESIKLTEIKLFIEEHPHL